MRIFVLGTGRCGTCTFYHACSHATNYTVGHETNYWRSDQVPHHDYPDWHIEVSHPLNVVAGLLADLYPEAKFVHLQRERDSCIESLVTNGLGPLGAFSTWNSVRDRADFPPHEVVDLYYHAVNSQLRRVLPADRSKHIWLHEVKDWWPKLWKWMECEGDLEASLCEWDRQYNHHASGRNASVETPNTDKPKSISNPISFTDRMERFIRSGNKVMLLANVKKQFKGLWRKASGRGGYNEKEWQTLQQALEQLGIPL